MEIRRLFPEQLSSALKEAAAEEQLRPNPSEHHSNNYLAKP